MNKVINILGLALFPVALCFSMPVFLYTLVLEKEQKLVETMKINGMKMRNYWTVSFTFFFMIYAMTVIIFYLTARFVFEV
jgi:hypothetical protein